MVSCIKARTLEDNAHRPDDLFQALLVALRTTRERLFFKGLLTFKLNAATFTTIRINWHTTHSHFQTYRHHYSAHIGF